MLRLLRTYFLVSACCLVGIALPATSGAGATATTAPASLATTLASNGASVTRIKVNGQFAEMPMVDPDSHTDGILAASRDQVANTTGLDFSYAYPIFLLL